MRGPTTIEAATQASLCALATATMVLVAGCGSTVSGTSVAPSDHHNAHDVTLDLLDPGKYPITAVPLAIAPSSSTGVVLEGQRMADAVVVPSEVDATLRHLRLSNTGVSRTRKRCVPTSGCLAPTSWRNTASLPGFPVHATAGASLR